MTGGLVEPVTARLPREPVFRKFHFLDSTATKVLTGDGDEDNDNDDNDDDRLVEPVTARLLP